MRRSNPALSRERLRTLGELVMTLHRVKTDNCSAWPVPSDSGNTLYQAGEFDANLCRSAECCFDLSLRTTRGASLVDTLWRCH
jgi:hypothetical protein